jgi:ketose-bisphosphate aldolase
MTGSAEILRNAQQAGLAILAFNVPYLPMVRPVVRAITDLDSFALIETARLEWIKFASQGLSAVAAEFARWNDPQHVHLHLDHVPVIDEDGNRVDYLPIFQQALDLGYHSVMIDASRLSLSENIAATHQVVELAHRYAIPCEAELGAVLGHEAGPLPPYDELFESGRGFTSAAEAQQYVRETGCDWLSVAIGNVHGAVSAGLKDQKKVEARLNLEHLEHLRQVTGVPLVLHGGSGIRREYVLAAIQKGIAKINIGTEIRQVYETALRETGSQNSAEEAVYERTCWLIKDYFGLAGIRQQVTEGAQV